MASRFDILTGEKPDPQKVKQEQVLDYLRKALDKATRLKNGERLRTSLIVFRKDLQRLFTSGQISQQVYTEMLEKTVDSSLSASIVQPAPTRQRSTEEEIDNYMRSTCGPSPSTSCSPSSNIAGRC